MVILHMLWSCVLVSFCQERSGYSSLLAIMLLIFLLWCSLSVDVVLCVIRCFMYMLHLHKLLILSNYTSIWRYWTCDLPLPPHCVQGDAIWSKDHWQLNIELAVFNLAKPHSWNYLSCTRCLRPINSSNIIMMGKLWFIGLLIDWHVQ